MRSIEIAVVGGGPAGAAAACGLAGAGKDVVLIERAPGPHHKVCGEFLSVETQAYLARLDINSDLLGAVPIDDVSLHVGTRLASVALPFRALSLSRFRLDEAILERAEKCGAELLRNVRVQSVEPLKQGYLLRCSNGDLFHCRKLVMATGKCALRGLHDLRDGTKVGLKMHLKASAAATSALSRRVELYLFDDGYVGLELIEDGIVNLCLILPKDAVSRIGRGWFPLRNFLTSCNQRLAHRLDALAALWERPLAVVCPSGGHLHSGPSRTDDAVYPVGDRFAHIPPFTGDGLGIALSTAALVVENICKGRSSSAYVADARRMTVSAVRIAGFISSIASGRVGRSALIGAAAHLPKLLQSTTRLTRMPFPNPMLTA